MGPWAPHRRGRAVMCPSCPSQASPPKALTLFNHQCPPPPMSPGPSLPDQWGGVGYGLVWVGRPSQCWALPVAAPGKSWGGVSLAAPEGRGPGPGVGGVGVGVAGCGPGGLGGRGRLPGAGGPAGSAEVEGAGTRAGSGGLACPGVSCLAKGAGEAPGCGLRLAPMGLRAARGLPDCTAQLRGGEGLSSGSDRWEPTRPPCLTASPGGPLRHRLSSNLPYLPACGFAQVCLCTGGWRAHPPVQPRAVAAKRGIASVSYKIFIIIILIII